MRLTGLIICTLIAGGLYGQSHLEATIKVRRSWVNGDPPLYLAMREAGKVVTIGYANGGFLNREELLKATQLYVPANYQIINFKLSYGNEEESELIRATFPTFTQDIREHLRHVNLGDTVTFSDIIIQGPDGSMILYRKMIYKIQSKRI